ncbi:hypothetical protein JXL19_09340 [bacterium]|nr:hypothetical protein [bacterium]
MRIADYHIGGIGVGGTGRPIGVVGAGSEVIGIGVGTGHVVGGGKGNGDGGVTGVGGTGAATIGGVGTVIVTGEGMGTGTVTGVGVGGGAIPGHMTGAGAKVAVQIGQVGAITGKSPKVNAGGAVITGIVEVIGVTVVASGATTVRGARDIGMVAVVVRALNCLKSESGETIGDNKGAGGNIRKGDMPGNPSE